MSGSPSTAAPSTATTARPSPATDLSLRCLDIAYRTRRLCELLAATHNLIIDARSTGEPTLRGLCAIGAHGLQMALRESGVESTFHHGGWCMGTYTQAKAHGHCWLSIDGLFDALDITATQFWMDTRSTRWTAPVVATSTRVGSPYHRLLSGDEALLRVQADRGRGVLCSQDQYKPLTYAGTAWWRG
jgi:hypothetical protein